MANLMQGMKFPNLRAAFRAWCERGLCGQSDRQVLVAAEDLPPRFYIASDYGGRALVEASPMALGRVRLWIENQPIVLEPHQRVRVLARAA